ncbi:ATP-dependent nuclease, subunit A [Anaerovibrio sp. JC8]|uniref:helicase-exonuclease AddAB subunit AddA n=1 Tax=Anaerovibrio sp. JC8 TaxID=1240085 RepID=UPI000A0AAFB0|nr:helicase-exonuclease AddAB subunit AddA [Anaerovibrio sp. JC8]ORT99578.1 ATP-dependent nuclease, subunit A [Anaerovibrio sp. JC8]
MEWSKEQKLAISNDEKNILVSAAAGSGKTAVLVERVVSHLLRDPEQDANAWDVDRLLVVTFTKAAADEMKQRIKKRLQEAIAQEMDKKEADKKMVRRLDRQLIMLSGASISTIDSFCQTVVKNNFNAIDIDPKFRIADDNELIILQQDVLEELFEARYMAGDEVLEGFAAKYGTDRGDGALYDIVLNLYEKSQNQPFPDLWLNRLAEDYLPNGKEISSIEETKWWPIMDSEISCRLAPAKAWLAELKSIVTNFEAPKVRGKFEEIVDAYDLVVTGLENAMGHGWHQMFAAMSLMKIPRTPGNLKDMEPEVKEAFVEVAGNLKDILGQINALVQDDEAVLLEELRESAKDVACIVQIVKDFAVAYSKAKREKNIADFSDVEHFALEILNSPEASPGELKPSDIALELRRRYQEIMVDEYQDTNEVQEFIVRLISGDGNANTFTVGDVKQSIYGFRSSEPGLFLKKYHSYEKADNNDGELITLGRNFRSRREILSAINYVFAQVMTPNPNEIEYDERAMLNEGEPYGYKEPEHGEVFGENVELALIDLDAEKEDEDEKKPLESLENPDDEGEELEGFELEAQYIATRLKEIKASGKMVFDKDCRENNGYRPVTWRDMVILLRATQNKADVLQEILQQNDIPVYANTSGGFFQTTEIQTMHSLLSVIDNAQQDIHLAAVLFSPIVGLSATELAKLKSSAKGEDMYTALLAANTPESQLEADIKEKVDAFLNQLSVWRQMARQISVPELIWQIFRDTGYYDYVGSLKGGILRQANLRMLITRAQEFQNTDYQGLFRFLRFIQRMTDMETDLSMARTLGEGEDVVRVMTIHKSKGLEFPVVVIADMCKSFNDMDLNNNVLIHKELGMGIRYVDPEYMTKYDTFARQAVRVKGKRELQAEELRVLYVAMTRAREKLIMVGRSKGMANRAAKWCQYIDATDRVLPVHTLLSVDSYADWVARAVAHHPDGLPLVDYSGTTKNRAAIPDAMGQESQWKVTVVNANDITGVNEIKDVDNELIQAVRAGKEMPVTAAAEALSAQLQLDYDYRGTREVPAKLTVSELKRRFAEEAVKENSMGDSQQLAAQHREYIFTRPRFIQEAEGKAGLKGNEYGTLMHSVMQHLDLNDSLDSDDVKKQLAGMVANEIMTEEQAGYINVKAVESFFKTDIGRRLKNASELWRELPFSRMLDAGEYYDNTEGEYIFSQGVIDVLFKENDGNYVLLDYKTDSNTEPEAVKKRYALQLQLYTSAAEAILGIKVGERYLYMLHDSSLISM